jgi:site-specific recombinase XerD
MKSTITSTSASSQINEPEQKLLTDAFMRYLVERGYARQTALSYVSYAGHFLHWVKLSHIDFLEISEKRTRQFLDDHLPHCACGWSKSRDQREAHAALGHMLVVLRTIGVAVPRPVIATPVDEELLRFDDYMGNVRGLGLKTRKSVLRITRVLLLDRFGDRPVVFTAIKPQHIRSCFARLTERSRSPLSTGSFVSALRSYFRYRATCGDAVYGLSGVARLEAPNVKMRRFHPTDELIAFLESL